MQDAIERAKAVKARFEGDWIRRSEIVSVGIGMITDSTPGIIIGIKAANSALEASIPDVIEDVPVTVQVIGEIKTQVSELRTIAKVRSESANNGQGENDLQ